MKNTTGISVDEIKWLLSNGKKASKQIILFYEEDIKKGVPYSEVVISKVDSWKDILRLAESNAINFDMETEDLIDKLEEYDDNFGISILQAETDTIVVGFITLPE